MIAYLPVVYVPCLSAAFTPPCLLPPQVLEVKVMEGLGTSIDCVLVNGKVGLQR